jgi:hypothetical protein
VQITSYTGSGLSTHYLSRSPACTCGAPGAGRTRRFKTDLVLGISSPRRKILLFRNLIGPCVSICLPSVAKVNFLRDLCVHGGSINFSEPQRRPIPRARHRPPFMFPTRWFR